MRPAGRWDRWSIEFEEGAVIDCRAQTFERHLYGYDLVPESLGGENLEKYRRVPHPGGRSIWVPSPSAPRPPARPA